MNITAKEQPKWYQLRWKLSFYLVKLARKVYPDNPDVKAFYLQAMTDQMIYGRHVVRVHPEKVWKE